MSEDSPEDRLSDTRDPAYADRLQALPEVWWKRHLDVQRPYRWNLRRQRLGRTLDVGCGVGRNLAMLDAASIGVDHNVQAVERCRELGLQALTTEEWQVSDVRQEESFDGILLAHVLEHIDDSAWEGLLDDYLPYLRPGGKVFFICPQERGYASDSTHVRFTDGDDLLDIARRVGLVPQGSWFSFPLPRFTGRLFTYNEFCLLARKPLRTA